MELSLPYIKLHYGCKDINNFGDVTPSYVYKKLGVNTVWSSADEADILPGGTILVDCFENNTIIGCGFGSPDDVCKTPKKILSVRGPLTRKRLLELGIECPEVYQDFADFLPMIYSPKIDMVNKIGYLPHYVDYDYVREKYQNDKVIDICSGVEAVIDEILSCEVVYTSSLHGIIACENYGIKWVWFKHNELASPDFKFQDYFARIGVENINAVEV